MTRLFAAAALAIVTATPAPAAIIQLTALGTITNGLSAGPGGLVNLGDAARFDLVYDTSVPDTNPSPGFGEYSGAFVSASARFGTIDVTSTSALTLEVLPIGESLLRYSSQSDVNSPFGTNIQLQFTIVNITQTLFPSDALPTGPLTATDFPGRFFRLSNSSVLATIDTITVTDITPVPLPAGGGLLLGALGLAALARRRGT